MTIETEIDVLSILDQIDHFLDNPPDMKNHRMQMAIEAHGKLNKINGWRAENKLSDPVYARFIAVCKRLLTDIFGDVNAR